jgi:ribosomal protein S18 acetylase RimI-like enzyme
LNNVPTVSSDSPALPVRKALLSEVDVVARVMTRAFSDDVIQQWCMTSDDTIGVIGRELLEVSRQLTANGSLWVTNDLSGVAAWMAPGTEYDDDALNAVVVPALDACGGQAERQLRFWKWADEHRPSESHWYVDVVGVDPDHRGRGLGKLLLEDGLARLDAIEAAAHLITDKLESARWYKRHGFVAQSVEQAPEGGPSVWFMWRPGSRD